MQRVIMVRGTLSLKRYCSQEWSARNNKGERNTELCKEERVETQHQKNVQGTACSKKEVCRKIERMKRRRYIMNND
jgi:hypothetical protein